MRAAAVLLAAAYALSSWEVSGAQALDAVMARVDQSVVTWSQVVQEAKIREWAREDRVSPDSRAVADALVRRMLLISEARKMRLEVTPEEAAAELTSLASAGGDAAVFWARMAQWGLSEAAVRQRCVEVLLVRRYLSLRQEMMYVPEADVRAFYSNQSDVFGRRPLSEVRDEVRAFLVQRKYQQELDQWIARQVSLGRVRLVDVSSTLADPLGSPSAETAIQRGK